MQVLGTLSIFVGVTIYEVKDTQCSPIGIAIALLNLLAAVTERIAQRYLLAVQHVDVSKPSLMILNNGIGAMLVVLGMQTYSSDEWCAILEALKVFSTACWVGASCLLGVSLSYCGIWLQVIDLPDMFEPRPLLDDSSLCACDCCPQGLITASSFMVLGAITKLLLIYAAILYMHDVSDSLSVFGAALSIFGGILYTIPS